MNGKFIELDLEDEIEVFLLEGFAEGVADIHILEAATGRDYQEYVRQVLAHTVDGQLTREGLEHMAEAISTDEVLSEAYATYAEEFAIILGMARDDSL